MKTKQSIEEIVEKFAAIEHDRWVRWQAYLHFKLTYQEKKIGDKTIAYYVMSADDYEHWQSQIDRSYDELSEAEKESDREQVRPYLEYFEQAKAQGVAEEQKRMLGNVFKDLDRLNSDWRKKVEWIGSELQRYRDEYLEDLEALQPKE